MAGSEPPGASPRRPKASALVRLKRNVSATFWLSYIVFAAAVGAFGPCLAHSNSSNTPAPLPACAEESHNRVAQNTGLYFGIVPALLLRPLNYRLHVRVSHAIVGASPTSRQLSVCCAPVADTPAPARPVCVSSAAVWCTLCLLVPERVNGARVRVTGQVSWGCHSRRDAAWVCRSAPWTDTVTPSLPHLSCRPRTAACW